MDPLLLLIAVPIGGLVLALAHHFYDWHVYMCGNIVFTCADAEQAKLLITQLGRRRNPELVNATQVSVWTKCSSEKDGKKRAEKMGKKYKIPAEFTNPQHRPLSFVDGGPL